jgi:hypothetical protein
MVSSTALDPAELGKHLHLFSLPPWNWGELGNVQVRVLKCHRNRSTVEILLDSAAGPRPLIGKVYAANRSDVYLAMEAISRAGFGPEAEFSIPQPFAYLPALNLLLQEKVLGVRAKDIFVEGKERDRAEAAERCALWLMRFHSVAPRFGPVFDLNQYLASLEQWTGAIAAVYKPLADKAGCLLERLRAAAATLSRVEVSAGHGSFCHAQIILANGRTATYDWDGYDVADPGRDVARFVVALGRLGLRYFGSIRALDSAADVFLKTYLAGRGEAQLNLPFYMGAVCVKIAKFEISRDPCPERQAIVETMLDEGLRILSGFLPPHVGRLQIGRQLAMPPHVGAGGGTRYE